MATLIKNVSNPKIDKTVIVKKIEKVVKVTSITKSQPKIIVKQNKVVTILPKTSKTVTISNTIKKVIVKANGGAPGESVYALAVRLGYMGTEEQFIEDITNANIHIENYSTTTDIATLLDLKVDKVAGKVLSDNNFSDQDVLDLAIALAHSGSSHFDGSWGSLTGRPLTITQDQADAIVANTEKVGITLSQEEAIVANIAKVGITPEQAQDISDNTSAILGKQDELTAGENITIDENNVISSVAGDQFPDQENQEDKFLSTDGTEVVWKNLDVPDSLPDQLGQEGKVLGTDGTDTTWVDDQTYSDPRSKIARYRDYLGEFSHKDVIFDSQGDPEKANLVIEHLDTLQTFVQFDPEIIIRYSGGKLGSDILTKLVSFPANGNVETVWSLNDSPFYATYNFTDGTIEFYGDDSDDLSVDYATGIISSDNDKFSFVSPNILHTGV